MLIRRIHIYSNEKTFVHIDVILRPLSSIDAMQLIVYRDGEAGSAAHRSPILSLSNEAGISGSLQRLAESMAGLKKGDDFMCLNF